MAEQVSQQGIKDALVSNVNQINRPNHVSKPYETIITNVEKTQGLNGYLSPLSTAPV